jgi:hypothetical protein
LHFLSQFIVTFSESVRFPLKNQNVGMMGQPIQKSRRQGGISKELRPTGKFKVGGDKKAPLLVPFRAALKEKRSSRS